MSSEGAANGTAAGQAPAEEPAAKQQAAAAAVPSGKGEAKEAAQPAGGEAGEVPEDELALDAAAERELDAQEATVTKEEIQQELDELKSDANLSVEELRAKYYGAAAAAQDEEDDDEDDDDEEDEDEDEDGDAEAKETAEDAQQELADIKGEAELSVEQLRAKYYGKRPAQEPKEADVNKRAKTN